MTNDTESTWTLFWDMHSGGGTKEPPYDKIYVEAPEGEARVIFFNRFGHSPDRVSCTCCGPDYSVEEGVLRELSAHHRGCAYDSDAEQYVERGSAYPSALTGAYRSLEDYLTEDAVLAISAAEIADDERAGSVPTQGFVWVGGE